MMNWSESDIIYLTLFKQIRLYQMFNPNNDKIFDVNVYRLICSTIVLAIECVLIYGATGIFFSGMTDDKDAINDILKFHLGFFYLINAHCLLKVIILVRQAHDIWPLLDVVRTQFLTSQNCQEHVHVLQKQRVLSRKITIFLCVLSIASSIQWALFPLVVNYTAKIPARKLFSSLNNVSCDIFNLEVFSNWNFHSLKNNYNIWIGDSKTW